MSKYILLAAGLILMLSCQMKVEPVLIANVDECEHCTMIIQDIDQGAVMLDANEDIHPYCSPVCMIKSKDRLKYSELPPKTDQYLFDHNSLTAIPASESFIVHGDFQTAMNHGLLAFSDKLSAEKFAAEMTGEIITWNDLRIAHGSPDAHIYLTDQAANSKVNKDNLVVVQYQNQSPDEVVISLLGYDDFELRVAPQSDDSTRFIASNPGQGFAFQKDETINIGTLFVEGEHTSEEAIYK